MCRQVDEQLERGRLQHRKVRRLLAFEDAAGIVAGLAMPIEEARIMAHQPAGSRKGLLVILVSGSIM
jgi:hypothetical protein